MVWVDVNCVYRIVSSPRAKATSPGIPAQFLAADTAATATVPVVMQAAAATEAGSGIPSNQLWFFRPAKNAHCGNFTLHNLAKGTDVCVERTATNEAKFNPVAPGNASQMWYAEGGPPSNPKVAWAQSEPPAASLAGFTGQLRAVGISAGPWEPPEDTVPQKTTVRLDIKAGATTVGVCKVAWSVKPDPSGWEQTTWDVNYIRPIAWNTTRTVPY